MTYWGYCTRKTHYPRNGKPRTAQVPHPPSHLTRSEPRCKVIKMRREGPRLEWGDDGTDVMLLYSTPQIQLSRNPPRSRKKSLHPSTKLFCLLCKLASHRKVETTERPTGLGFPWDMHLLERGRSWTFRTASSASTTRAVRFVLCIRFSGWRIRLCNLEMLVSGFYTYIF